MPLTDTAVRQAKATGKPYTLKDTAGLGLFVGPTGGKQWHFRFYWLGTQARISLGTYPSIGLKAARLARDKARELVAEGVDPRVDRREARVAACEAAENSFAAVFEEWRAFKELTLKEGRQSTLSQIDRHFKKDLIPFMGTLVITDICRSHLLEALRRIECRGAMTTAEKCRTWLNQLFRYAMVKKELDTNPAADLDMVALPKPKVRHNPHLIMSELPAFLRVLRGYGGRSKTKDGIWLLFLTGVRTGELRFALPDQFDLSTGLWTIPPEVVKQLQVKGRKESGVIPPYIVPLSRTAIDIVRGLIDSMLPGQRYLLPHRSDLRQPISENTLNAAIKRMGYAEQLTGHGIRGTLSTALNELGFEQKWIDAQLSHADPNKVRRSYNHAKYVSQRASMMQDWAERLDCWERGMPQPPLPRLVAPHGLEDIAMYLKKMMASDTVARMV